MPEKEIMTTFSTTIAGVPKLVVYKDGSQDFVYPGMKPVKPTNTEILLFHILDFVRLNYKERK